MEKVFFCVCGRYGLTAQVNLQDVLCWASVSALQSHPPADDPLRDACHETAVRSAD